MKDIDVYISGETVDLCIPTRDFAKISQWYNLLNNPKITRFLEYGAFPNTAEKQEEFFNSLGNSRLVLIILTKKTRIFKGVVSLSFLNFSKKSCDIAIVTDGSIEPKNSKFTNLEAMALITEHGFKNMGMLRIAAGQHIELGKWQQKLELIGYKLEGIATNRFNKAHERADTMEIACTYDDYLAICKNRGSLWDSSEKMLKRFAGLPSKSFKSELQEFYANVRKSYYDNLFKI